jgi:hypothetical protein
MCEKRVPASTLFGLKQNSPFKVYYDLGQKRVTHVDGAPSLSQPVRSSSMAFSMPLWFSLNGLLLFPTSYEIVTNGIVVYHTTQAPDEGIRVLKKRHQLDEGSTEVKAILKPDQLMSFPTEC